MEYSNFDTADSLAAMEAAGIRFTQIRSDQSGIISYVIDSLEDLEPSQIEESVFDRRSIPVKLSDGRDGLGSMNLFTRSLHLKTGPSYFLSARRMSHNTGRIHS